MPEQEPVAGDQPVAEMVNEVVPDQNDQAQAQILADAAATAHIGEDTTAQLPLEVDAFSPIEESKEEPE